MPVILLVDDNKLNQLVAKGTLKRLNYAVEIVDSGADAVRACASRGFDAVLMDIMMPGMDGFEATARIRAVDATRGDGRHTPIIGLSARAMLRAVGMGDDDWEKPQIGVASAWNEITPCNATLRRLAQQVKAGVHEAGGFPLEFGTITVSDGISMGHELSLIHI